jgi:hypothetical protein
VTSVEATIIRENPRFDLRLALRCSGQSLHIPAPIVQILGLHKTEILFFDHVKIPHFHEDSENFPAKSLPPMTCT